MLLALIGSAGAAYASGFAPCADSATAVQSAAAGKTDCDMGRNKMHKCTHDACCGYSVMALAEAGDFSIPPAPRSAAAALVTKHLTASAREPLLDPPRA